MATTAGTWDLYAAAFSTTSRLLASPDQPLFDRPDLVGSIGTKERPHGRLLVLDDGALDTLRGLPDPWATFVEVAAHASRCSAHMEALGRYRSSQATAMVRTLDGLAEPTLPAGLQTRRVSVTPTGSEVRLVDATTAFLRADHEPDLSAEGLAGYLASLPGATLLVAVDDVGEVRATAGAAVFDRYARVLFVSTDFGWRGRGVGTAMTGAALRVAREGGATNVCLAASAAGYGIYLRLGFDPVGALALFEHLD